MPTCSTRIVRKKYSEIVPKDDEISSGDIPSGSASTIPSAASRSRYRWRRSGLRGNRDANSV